MLSPAGLDLFLLDFRALAAALRTSLGCLLSGALTHFPGGAYLSGCLLLLGNAPLAIRLFLLHGFSNFATRGSCLGGSTTVRIDPFARHYEIATRTERDNGQNDRHDYLPLLLVHDGYLPQTTDTGQPNPIPQVSIPKPPSSTRLNEPVAHDVSPRRELHTI